MERRCATAVARENRSRTGLLLEIAHSDVMGLV